jgi:hypothetical protein
MRCQTLSRDPKLIESLRDSFLSHWVVDVEILAHYIALHHGDTSYLEDSICEFPLNYWNDVAGSKVRLATSLWPLPSISYLPEIPRTERKAEEYTGLKSQLR